MEKTREEWATLGLCEDCWCIHTSKFLGLLGICQGKISWHFGAGKQTAWDHRMRKGWDTYFKITVTSVLEKKETQLIVLALEQCRTKPSPCRHPLNIEQTNLPFHSALGPTERKFCLWCMRPLEPMLDMEPQLKNSQKKCPGLCLNPNWLRKQAHGQRAWP